MSFPFGKMPTLVEYLRWAISQGMTVQSGVGRGPGGRQETFRCITNSANGRHVIIAKIKDEERLLPSLLTNLDRRLGVKSGFPTFDNFDRE